MSLRGCPDWVLLLALASVPGDVAAQAPHSTESTVVVDSDDWRLIGDLVVPDRDGPHPAVLLLNKADGDRSSYATLATELALRGLASLRLDLRGHGESTNLGEFVPGERSPDPLIWDAEVDVVAAHRFLQRHPGIDADRIGVVGASYSGEEAAEAGRVGGYAQAYVMLSPGSFEPVSVAAIDSSEAPWLFVASRNERYLTEITESVLTESQSAEVLLFPGSAHATRLLSAHPELAARLAVWLAEQLR